MKVVVMGALWDPDEPSPGSYIIVRDLSDIVVVPEAVEYLGFLFI